MKTTGKAVFALATVLILMSSCKKNEDQFDIPEVYTASVTNIGETSVIASGSVANDGGGEIEERGFVLSTGPTPTLETGIKRLSGTGTGTYSSSITGLLGGTNYYLRAFATNEAGTGYGNAVQFTTLELLSFGFNGATISVYPEDNTIYSVWGPQQSVGAVSAVNGEGNTNTISGYPNPSAAKICHELMAFGYNDWYLPAIDELEALYEHRELWGNFNNPQELYWSSTEESADQARTVSFSTGEEVDRPKNSQHGCRCVRKEF